MGINLMVHVTGSGRNWGRKERALQMISKCEQGQKYWFHSWQRKVSNWAEWEQGIRER